MYLFDLFLQLENIHQLIYIFVKTTVEKQLLIYVKCFYIAKTSNILQIYFQGYSQGLVTN